MPSPLESSMKNDGAAHLYTDEYWSFMTSHVEYLRSHPSTQLLQLEKMTVEKHLNNFHGLFEELKIRFEDHQLMMMVNRFSDPLSLDHKVERLLVPDNVLVERLKNIFRTTQQ